MKKLIFVSTAAAIVAFSGTTFAQDVVVKVPQTVREYVIAHPADPVIIEENITEGYVLPETVEVHPIPDDPGFGYIYVDGSPVIVSMDNRQVVYYADEPNSGPVIPDGVVTYIESNPLPPVVYEGEIVEGTVIPDTLPLEVIPDQPSYSYIYINERPALVETDTRRILWVK